MVGPRTKLHQFNGRKPRLLSGWAGLAVKLTALILLGGVCIVLGMLALS
jgi:hypothetical protein